MCFSSTCLSIHSSLINCNNFKCLYFHFSPVMAYMEMFGNCSHSTQNTADFMRHSVHTYNMNHASSEHINATSKHMHQHSRIISHSQTMRYVEKFRIHRPNSMLLIIIEIILLAYHQFRSNQSENCPVQHFHWIYHLNICHRHCRPNGKWRVVRRLVYRVHRCPAQNYHRPQCIMSRCQIRTVWLLYHHHRRHRQRNPNTNVNSNYNRKWNNHRKWINRHSTLLHWWHRQCQPFGHPWLKHIRRHRLQRWQRLPQLPIEYHRSISTHRRMLNQPAN